MAIVSEESLRNVHGTFKKKELITIKTVGYPALLGGVKAQAAGKKLINKMVLPVHPSSRQPVVATVS